MIVVAFTEAVMQNYSKDRHWPSNSYQATVKFQDVTQIVTISGDISIKN